MNLSAIIDWPAFLADAIERGERAPYRPKRLTDEGRAAFRALTGEGDPLFSADEGQLGARLCGLRELAFHQLIDGNLHLTNRGLTALQRASDR